MLQVQFGKFSVAIVLLGRRHAFADQQHLGRGDRIVSGIIDLEPGRNLGLILRRVLVQAKHIVQRDIEPLGIGNSHRYLLTAASSDENVSFAIDIT